MTDAASDVWSVWICEALLQGRTRDAIATILQAQGMAHADALARIDQLQRSPGMIAARRSEHHVAARFMSLHRQQLGVHSGQVARRDSLTEAEWRDVWAAHGIPLVVTGFADDWPARAWTWANLRSAHGGARVRACIGRSTWADPDARFEQLVQEVSLAELLDAIEGGSGDDAYLVSRGQALERGLASLKQDLAPPSWLVADAPHGRNHALWVGGAGTRTRLHHDASHILFVQLLGRKHWWLAPPILPELSQQASGYYAGEDLDDPETRNRLALPGLRETVLEPGDALWIPAGWWHQVRSLEPSVSAGFVGLTIPNRFPQLELRTTDVRPSPPRMRTPR